MNVYVISVDDYDYDEYDGFVVVAESEHDAMNMVCGWLPKSQINQFRNYSHITYVGLTHLDPGILLSSFHAG